MSHISPEFSGNRLVVIVITALVTSAFGFIGGAWGASMKLSQMIGEMDIRIRSVELLASRAEPTHKEIFNDISEIKADISKNRYDFQTSDTQLHNEVSQNYQALLASMNALSVKIEQKRN